VRPSRAPYSVPIHNSGDRRRNRDHEGCTENSVAESGFMRSKHVMAPYR